VIRYHARWVVPISSPPIRDGTVVEDGGRIVYAGPRATAPAGADVDLGRSVLMPGLVNAHTHLELTVMRGFLEDLDFQSWVFRLTKARREVLTPEALLDSARAGIAEGLLAGITTYADTNDSSAPFHAMLERGVRGISYQEVFGPHPDQCTESLGALKHKVETLREQETALVRIGVSPHAPYSVSDALFAATAQYARDESLPIAVHIAESEDETRFVTTASGGWAESHRARGIPVEVRGESPIRMLAKARVLEAKPLLIHCVRTDATDIAAIKQHDCAVAHCPVSNAKLAHGIAPVLDMLDAGIRVGLGSDSVASNNAMDLLAEARVASLMQRARSGRPNALDAGQSLALATLGGARALALDTEIGSLEVGKSADLAAFALGSHGSDPVYDPATALVFSGASHRALFVAVAGNVLVREGRLVGPAARIVDLTPYADALDAWSRNRARA
jgi:5-methylthioadenosine/S-adenosylhomocysteine deaminase